MKLYYCFNGVFDFEYYVNDLEVAKEISKMIDKAIEVEAVREYAKIYQQELLERYRPDAYWEYLSETKADIIDDKRAENYRRMIEAEDEILGYKRRDYNECICFEDDTTRL